MTAAPLRIISLGAGVQSTTMALMAALRGKNLCCWCPLDGPCHADVLLDLANPGLKCEAA